VLIMGRSGGEVASSLEKERERERERERVLHVLEGGRVTHTLGGYCVIENCL